MEHKNIQEKVKILEDQNQVYKNDLERGHETVQNFNNQIANMQKQMEMYDQEINNLKIQMKKKDEDIEAYQEEFENIEENMKANSQESSSLHNENERLKEQIQDLKNQMLKTTITKAQELASDRQSSLSSRTISIEQMEQIEEPYREKIDKLNRELLKSKKEHDDLKVYLDKIIMSIIEKDPSILEVK